MEVMRAVVVTITVTFAVALPAVAEDDHRGHWHAPTEATCEAARTEALHRCAHYTDTGRDRCDAKAEDAYKKCLSRVPKHHN